MKASKQFVLQGIQQLLGIPYIYFSHGFRLPAGDFDTQERYSLPFEGEWTAVNGGLGKEFSHSWEIPTQRYAYDFVIMDDEGKTYRGDAADVAAYACYGRKILAPADGTVAAVGDLCKDEIPFTDEKTVLCPADIRGNYILIRHAQKEYSFLGHLQPGSITVQTGQRVRRGEAVARCGNSGNTSEPHLHFQIQDGPGFFTSAGLSVTFQDLRFSRKKGYEKYDTRTVPEIFAPDRERIRIGRGWQVENG